MREFKSVVELPGDAGRAEQKYVCLKQRRVQGRAASGQSNKQALLQ